MLQINPAPNLKFKLEKTMFKDRAKGISSRQLLVQS